MHIHTLVCTLDAGKKLRNGLFLRIIVDVSSAEVAARQLETFKALRLLLTN